MAAAELDHVSQSAWTGERWLVLAVFEDAWFCALGIGSDLAQTDISEAEQWFADNRVWPFSFRHVCDILDLEPELVRRALMRQRSQPKRRLRFRSGQKGRWQAL